METPSPDPAPTGDEIFDLDAIHAAGKKLTAAMAEVDAMASGFLAIGQMVAQGVDGPLPEADGAPDAYADLAYRLRDRTPGLSEEVRCPAESCQVADADPGPLFAVIMHINDEHKWPRNIIADWLDTLDIDLTVHHEPPSLIDRVSDHHAIEDVYTTVAHHPSGDDRLSTYTLRIRLAFDGPELTLLPLLRDNALRVALELAESYIAADPHDTWAPPADLAVLVTDITERTGD